MIDLQRARSILVRSDPRRPLYRQLVEILRGARAPAERLRLPTERQLATGLRMARVTVRKALDELAREGLVERRQGAGTYLVPAPARSPGEASVERDCCEWACLSEALAA